MTENAGATHTFLFTDIEGSTRLLQARRGLPALLSEHRQLIERRRHGHGGRVFGTEGDALFCVVLRRAAAALAAAVDAQRALAAHEWPDGQCDPRAHGHPHRRGHRDR